MKPNTLLPLLAAGIIGCSNGNSIPPASPEKFSAGAGYVHLTAPPDRVYGFDGQLRGGKTLVTIPWPNTDWYYGVEVMVYGNHASNTQVTPKGTNEYTLHTLGSGVGFVGGYQYENHENLGVGIESQLALMQDDVTRERTKNSGLTSFDNLLLVYGYTGFGVRLKASSLCVIPSAGFRTDLTEAFPMGSVSIAYCPNKR